jgi:PAS domain S-box-containing protein
MKKTNYLKEELYELIKTDESIFDFIQESSLDGLWYWDLEHPEEEWMNPKFWSVLGYDHKEMPHKTSAWQDIIHPDDLKLATENFIKHCENPDHPYDQTVRYTHKNGSTVWIRCRGFAIRDKHGKPLRMLGAHQEITAIKNNQILFEKNAHLLRNALLEKEALLKHLNYALDASGDGIWDWTPADGKTVYSKAWIEMLGYKVGELASLASEWSDRLHPDEAEWVFAVVNKVTQTPENGDTFSHEYRFRNKAGDYLWILNKAKVVDRNEKGKASRVVGTHTDITEQKIYNQALTESELRFSVAIEGTEAGIWDWDMLNNKVVFSIQWKAMLGYEDAEIENSFEGWQKLWHPDDAPLIEKSVNDHLNGVSEKYEVIHRCLHKDGVWRWIMTRGKILRNPEGKPYRWVGTNVDITAQKQAEENQKTAKKQAEAATKAKSEFLANMSHELRTPLNGVIGFTELLTKTPLNPLQQQYANSANVSGHILLGIINNILDFSKIEAGMLELEVIKTDMVELLENSIDIVKFTSADKAFELLLDIDPSMPRFAHIDAIRIQQILANLLSNAVKFTQKGEVALKAVYQALDDKQGKLSIFVRDTGIGITEDQKAKLFKTFSQADSSTTRKFGGTGLGLVISQLIAEKTGSKINIDSIPEVGSTFSFDIITHFEEGEKLDTTKITGVKRCLIIDDNDNNRLIMEQMLKQWQIESDSCNNGLDALKKLESSQPYDLIICDYDMPYLNGIETIRLMKDKLKLNTENQPIILLHSSIDNEELNKKSKELGIRFRLNKPVKSHDLFNYLSHLDQTSETIPQKESEQTIKLSHTSDKLKILIAEDNPLNMVLSKTILSQLLPNSEVYEARNGLEAIEQYQSISPDLIFMDVQMPELDGIEATKKIRALEVTTSNHLPIVALTAGALMDEKEKCLAAGMDDFLTKPLESKKIQTVLHKFFQQGKKVNADFENRDAKNEIHFGFSEFTSNLENDMVTAQQMIMMFITNMPTEINRLQQACNEIDLANIKSIAHSIKGISLTLCCSILGDIAGKMEKAARDSSFENVEILLTELKEEWKTVKNLLLQNVSLKE